MEGADRGETTDASGVLPDVTSDEVVFSLVEEWDTTGAKIKWKIIFPLIIIEKPKSNFVYLEWLSWHIENISEQLYSIEFKF